MTTTTMTTTKMMTTTEAGANGPAAHDEGVWIPVKSRRKGATHKPRAPSPTPSTASAASTGTSRSAFSIRSGASRSSAASAASTVRGAGALSRDGRSQRSSSKQPAKPSVATVAVGMTLSGQVASVDKSVAWIECGLAKQGRLLARKATAGGGFVADLSQMLPVGTRLEHLTVTWVEPPMGNSRGKLELSVTRLRQQEEPPRQQEKQSCRQEDTELPRSREHLPWGPKAVEQCRAERWPHAGLTLLDFLVEKPAKAGAAKKAPTTSKLPVRQPQQKQQVQTKKLQASAPARASAPRHDPSLPLAAAVVAGEELLPAPAPTATLLLSRVINGKAINLCDLQWKTCQRTTLMA